MPSAAIDLENLFASNGGVASTAQLRSVMSRKTLAALVRSGQILRVCRGVYSDHVPGTLDRLAALDILTSMPIVACMNTAAELHGFDTEHDDRVHILDPGLRIRPDDGLMVHQRVGAPLKRVSGRLATTPAWTAVELARTLRRPRALAILDAALHVGACDAAELDSAVREQKGRRGIVAVRDLLAHADARAESPMESEMRLVFIDWCVPRPELQYEIIDRHGEPVAGGLCLARRESGRRIRQRGMARHSRRLQTRPAEDRSAAGVWLEHCLRGDRRYPPASRRVGASGPVAPRRRRFGGVISWVAPASRHGSTGKPACRVPQRLLAGRKLTHGGTGFH